MTIFLDIAPSAGTFGIFAGAAFLLIFAAVAFIAFKMLKRTVKMAFRIGIVAVILMVAVAGSVAVWALGSGTAEKPRTSRAK